MARTWLSITVELVQGHGESLWPRPARIFAAARSHTFAQLAEAIDDAFARWDRAHLHEFSLADGTRITTPGDWDEGEPPLDEAETRLSRLKPGERFVYAGASCVPVPACRSRPSTATTSGPTTSSTRRLLTQDDEGADRGRRVHKGGSGHPRRPLDHGAHRQGRARRPVRSPRRTGGDEVGYSEASSSPPRSSTGSRRAGPAPSTSPPASPGRTASVNRSTGGCAMSA
jgi:hypothetical protein